MRRAHDLLHRGRARVSGQNPHLRDPSRGGGNIRRVLAREHVHRAVQQRGDVGRGVLGGLDRHVQPGLLEEAVVLGDVESGSALGGHGHHGQVRELGAVAGLAEAVPHPARAVAVVIMRSAAARAWRGMRKRILGSPLLRWGGCEDPAWFGDERRVFALPGSWTLAWVNPDQVASGVASPPTRRSPPDLLGEFGRRGRGERPGAVAPRQRVRPELPGRGKPNDHPMGILAAEPRSLGPPFLIGFWFTRDSP